MFSIASNSFVFNSLSCECILSSAARVDNKIGRMSAMLCFLLFVLDWVELSVTLNFPVTHTHVHEDCMISGICMQQEEEEEEGRGASWMCSMYV